MNNKLEIKIKKPPRIISLDRFFLDEVFLTLYGLQSVFFYSTFKKFYKCKNTNYDWIIESNYK